MDLIGLLTLAGITLGLAMAMWTYVTLLTLRLKTSRIEYLLDRAEKAEHVAMMRMLDSNLQLLHVQRLFLVYMADRTGQPVDQLAYPTVEPNSLGGEVVHKAPEPSRTDPTQRQVISGTISIEPVLTQWQPPGMLPATSHNPAHTEALSHG